jgi:hypothetical protein
MRYDDKFQLRDPDEVAREQKDRSTSSARASSANTDSRGFPTPRDRDPLDSVVDATEGFIPLWARDVRTSGLRRRVRATEPATPQG